MIQQICDMLRTHNFNFEFEVKAEPKGIRVVYEVTQEQLDATMAKAFKGR